jgi:hypothetical protein
MTAVKKSRLYLADCRYLSMPLVGDEHDGEYDKEDGEEGAEWDEYAFAQVGPTVGLLVAVFGADGGLVG